ncbi:MAG: hypothetical protein RL365_243 [Bacteroidota bacterium]|jgi:hypothetical protein
MSWKIGLIGTGNVASFWAKNLNRFPSVELFVQGRTPEASNIFSEKFNIQPLESQSVDCFLICVQDRNIDHILQTMDSAVPTFVCAGLYSLKRSAHKNSGIIYPLQTIQINAMPSFDEVPFLCEFSSNVRACGLRFLTDFNLSFTETTEEARFTAHISAVFINNFGYYTMKRGLSLAETKDLPADLFKPIIDKTIANLFIQGDLQTGPARRNDLETIATHQANLGESSREIYDFISNSIMKTYGNEL